MMSYRKGLSVRPVQPKASSAFSRARRWSIMLLRPFWSSSPEPPRSTVTSASPSLRGRQGFPTSYVTLRSRHLAVSNTESEDVSQEFLPSPRGRMNSANGALKRPGQRGETIMLRWSL